jgi:hypothetical protein
MSTKQDWPRPYSPAAFASGWERVFAKPANADLPQRGDTASASEVVGVDRCAKSDTERAGGDSGEDGCGCDFLAMRGIKGLCRKCRMEAQDDEAWRADDLNDCEP